MSDKKTLLITPQTRVGELLDAYPELEPVLIEAAPPFKKLRNPVLRRTVARVTSLSQAARVGNVSVIDLVQQLRRTIGQPEFVHESSDKAAVDTGAAPAWVDMIRVARVLDARPLIDAGQQPLGQVMRELSELEPGQIFELITPFEPAPLIDKATARGYRVWTLARSRDEYRTYFTSG